MFELSRMKFQAWQAFCKIKNKDQYVVVLVTENHACN